MPKNTGHHIRQFGLTMVGYYVILAIVLAVALYLSLPSWTVFAVLFLAFVGFGFLMVRWSSRRE